MDANDVRVLCDYNAWANRRSLEACAQLTHQQFTHDLKSSFPSIRETLFHIYAAEWIWMERWHHRSPAAFPKAADYPDFEAVQRALSGMDAALIDYVGRLSAENLAGHLEYKLMNGATAKGRLAPMLQHLANHSTYHRGQIATMLRQLGAQAVSTDLIAYHRELESKASA